LNILLVSFLSLQNFFARMCRIIPAKVSRDSAAMYKSQRRFETPTVPAQFRRSSGITPNDRVLTPELGADCNLADCNLGSGPARPFSRDKVEPFLTMKNLTMKRSSQKRLIRVAKPANPYDEFPSLQRPREALSL